MLTCFLAIVPSRIVSRVPVWCRGSDDVGNIADLGLEAVCFCVTLTRISRPVPVLKTLSLRWLARGLGILVVACCG